MTLTVRICISVSIGFGAPNLWISGSPAPPEAGEGWNKLRCVTYTQLTAYLFAIYPCMIHKSLTVKRSPIQVQVQVQVFAPVRIHIHIQVLVHVHAMSWSNLCKLWAHVAGWPPAAVSRLICCCWKTGKPVHVWDAYTGRKVRSVEGIRDGSIKLLNDLSSYVSLVLVLKRLMVYPFNLSYWLAV